MNSPGSCAPSAFFLPSGRGGRQHPGMPSITTEISHSLPVPEASERVKGLMTRLRRTYAGRIRDVDESWGGDRGDFSFTLSGARIKGSTDVAPDRVRVRVEIPLLALAFKSSIQQTIRDEVRSCLS